MTLREEQVEAGRAFGRYLVKERELRELTRARVVKLTRLSASLVETLESGEPARMPRRPYVYGYLRAYAGAVGLDADDVVLRWQEVVGPGPEEQEAAPPAPRLRVPVVRAAVALLVFLALVAVALLTFLGPHQARTAVVKSGASAPAAQKPGRGSLP